jgi:hypothetical protein
MKNLKADGEVYCMTIGKSLESCRQEQLLVLNLKGLDFAVWQARSL